MWTVDENGYYGQFGGAYIPEMLYSNVENLRNNYLKIILYPVADTQSSEVIAVF